MGEERHVCAIPIGEGSRGLRGVQGFIGADLWREWGRDLGSMRVRAE
jgi:hypothetical protein